MIIENTHLDLRPARCARSPPLTFAGKLEIMTNLWAKTPPGCSKQRTHVRLRWRADTSLLRGDHQSLGGLAPALPRLRRDAEHVDGLRLQVGHRVLASAGVEDIHGGHVAVGGVVVVGDLVGWREGGRCEAQERVEQTTRGRAKRATGIFVSHGFIPLASAPATGASVILHSLK